MESREEPSSNGSSASSWVVSGSPSSREEQRSHNASPASSGAVTQAIARQEVEEITRIVSKTANEVYRNLNAGNFDLTELPGSAVDKLIESLANANKTQQLTIGGISGWISGFLFRKIGKPFLYLMAGGAAVVLIAEHQGYLQVDWDRVRNDYSSGRKAVKDRLAALNEQAQGVLSRRNGKRWTEKLKRLATSSPYLGGGFVGGALLGLAV